MKAKLAVIGLCLIALSGCGGSSANENRKIGETNTKFNFFSPNDKIKIESFSDPQVKGVTCYVSYAKKGGMKSVMNLEEDNPNSSLDCVKTSKYLEYNENDLLAKDSQQVFKRSASLAFKTTQVMRYYDQKKKSFIYMIYSDKILDGSPENSIATVSCGDDVVSKTVDNKTIIGDCHITNFNQTH